MSVNQKIVERARQLNADKPDMRVEARQTKLQANAEAIERWQRKLFRAATELKKLTEQRKRLLYLKGKSFKPRADNLEEIRMAASGYDFNDDLPL